MNILHVIRDLSPTTGGPVTMLLGLAEAQSSLGHRVVIAATGEDPEISPKGGDIRTVVYPCQAHGWSWSTGLAKALPDLISSADMVHLHTVWEFPIWAAARAAKRQRKPYIIRPCGMLDEWSLSRNAFKKKVYLKLIGNSIVSNAAAVHFTSEGEWDKSLPLARGNNAFIIPNGLPSSAYVDLPDSSLFSQMWPETAGKRIVLFLGRLHPKKQPEVVISSFKKTCEEWNDLHLVLAGPCDKQYLAILHNVVNNFGLGEKVTFTGLLQGDELRAAYRAAYLFVLPSLQENFGLAVAEAMAAACPVIVSDRVDLFPDIASANAGLVCAPDTQSTTDAMRLLLRDEARRCAMGGNARKLALEKFTWERISRKLIGIYEGILVGKKKNLSWR